MKKLFDETYEYNRTVWYLFEEDDNSMHYIFSQPNEYGGRIISSGDYSILADSIKRLIADDLQNTFEEKPTETHWIFYSSIVDDDAIGDKVRFSILVRLKNGSYSCNINVSDYIFATSFDEIIKIKNIIEASLNL
ncbi:hypothetical protein JK636_19150 [Clostridium sp. YIM B02515]|uniref:Uncharacterized protein n=1 Tax=Clostridium rhizosphaerae TaxID=2803861 RepID=A0ABS1TEM0_9CLOT|nr:hypothetical protein [Clostridium rhizosphaerae]MBL4937828.1 hypothetical protein [Clostridium rhizosphaerae]